MQIGLQLGYIECNFYINSVDFISHKWFHDDESHFDGFHNIIIIQMHIVWSDYLICVECGCMQSHVLGGPQIHNPFAYVPEMCPNTH